MNNLDSHQIFHFWWIVICYACINATILPYVCNLYYGRSPEMLYKLCHCLSVRVWNNSSCKFCPHEMSQQALYIEILFLQKNISSGYSLDVIVVCLLISTHNICFHQKSENINIRKSALSGAFSKKFLFFLYTSWKHMFWVFIRSALQRHF